MLKILTVASVCGKNMKHLIKSFKAEHTNLSLKFEFSSHVLSEQ